MHLSESNVRMRPLVYMHDSGISFWVLINPRQRRSHANMTSGTQSMIQARPPLRVFLWVCAYIYTYTYVYVFLCFVFRARTVPPLMVMAVFFFFFLRCTLQTVPLHRGYSFCVSFVCMRTSHTIFTKGTYTHFVCVCVFSVECMLLIWLLCIIWWLGEAFSRRGRQLAALQWRHWGFSAALVRVAICSSMLLLPLVQCSWYLAAVSDLCPALFAVFRLCSIIAYTYHSPCVVFQDNSIWCKYEHWLFEWVCKLLCDHHTVACFCGACLF